MKSTGIIRNVDDLGRIVIPKELRTSLNMTEGAPLEMYIEGNNLILARVYKGCYLCDSTADLTDFNGKAICSSCIEKIKTL
jgi:transcriptional pleiotropic regulator of transition state genes